LSIAIGTDAGTPAYSAVLDAAERGFQISDKGRERPLGGTLPRDQYVIGFWSPAVGQDFGRYLPQSPLRSISHYSISDFSARGESDPDVGEAAALLRSLRRLQNQTRSRRAAAGGRNPHEIGATLELSETITAIFCVARPPHADKRLRPFARRAASTRRPATVAIRARKPCRRLRTSLLGW
jgi:hypothetical protein